MSTAAEHFASIDRQLADTRAAHEAEKKQMSEHILVLETELAIRTRLHEEAIRAKESAMRTTAKLLAQFGVVATVFEEAKSLAMQAGLYTNPDPTSKALTAIDEAIAASNLAPGGMTMVPPNELSGAK